MKHALSLRVGFNLAVLLAVSGGVAAEPNSVDRARAAEANLNLGVAYYRADNLVLAKDKLERAREQNPRNAQVHGTLALLYARLGDDAQADSEFNAAARLAPGEPEQMNNYAVYLCGRGKVDAGVQWLVKAALNPLYSTPWVAWTNAGVCLRAAHRAGEAAALFDQALKAQPGYAEAAYQYADLELERGQSALALRRVEGWLAANPRATPELLFTGWRAARAAEEPWSAMTLARRLQMDFPSSSQTLALAGGAAAGGGYASH